MAIRKSQTHAGSKLAHPPFSPPPLPSQFDTVVRKCSNNICLLRVLRAISYEITRRASKREPSRRNKRGSDIRGARTIRPRREDEVKESEEREDELQADAR